LEAEVLGCNTIAASS